MRILNLTTTILLTLVWPLESSSQTGPWNSPLMMALSNDGQTFNTPTVFQDSSGVPSVVRWKGDTLACVFQWFRQPMGSATWDRVAVKFSFDNGLHWTTPTPIVIIGMPVDYQRPFDPTLAVLSSDSLRIYFSSSRGFPPPGLDSSINTYSAISTDGVNYIFERNPRVDHPTGKVIDPAVIYFNGMWHDSSPIGSPQQGAYHYTSPDGLIFSPQSNYPSDNTHNWTGNYVSFNGSELRFYGSGPRIWYNTSADGFNWSGYVNTNIIGGDPTAVKLASSVFLLIYVGPPYSTDVAEENVPYPSSLELYQNYPNPFNPTTTIRYSIPASVSGLRSSVTLKVFDLLGREAATIVNESLQTGEHTVTFNASGLPSGVYIYRLQTRTFTGTKRMVLIR